MLIAALTVSLAPGGVLVVQCPNANSREYLAYFRSRLRARVKKIDPGSNFPRLAKIGILLGTRFLHGIDPPRHLWAITRRGIMAWAHQHELTCVTFTRHLGDVPFSPTYIPPPSLFDRVADSFGQNVLSYLTGGTHLVAVIRKTEVS